MSEKRFIQMDLFGENDRCISKFVKSPLNYTGGKYKLLPQIYSKLPKDFDTFVDVFGGGFNVGANIDCSKVIYNDFNNKVCRIIKLLYSWKESMIVSKIEEIITIYKLSDTYHKGYSPYNVTGNLGLSRYNDKPYRKLREEYNSLKENSEYKDLLLFILGIYGFNNQLRFNSKGENNVPVGKADFNENVRTNLKEFCETIQNKNVDFYSLSFEDLPYESFDKPFFYCDPPYLITDAPYTKEDMWDDTMEHKLLNWLSMLNAKGYKFALSNVLDHKGKSNDILKEWIAKNNFKVYDLEMSYKACSYQGTNTDLPTREVLITNYTIDR